MGTTQTCFGVRAHRGAQFGAWIRPLGCSQATSKPQASGFISLSLSFPI